MGLSVDKEPVRVSLIKNGLDPDKIMEFLEETVGMSRSIDEASRSLLGESKFYKRELIYSEIDKLLLMLRP